MTRARITAALFIALATGSGSAQEVAPATFGEVLNVSVVNIEVVVTDREGHPVTGLGPGDFVLRVDDEPVPIDYFDEVRFGDVAIRPEADGSLGVPALEPGASAETSYLVFIDDYWSVRRDRDRVIESLSEDLTLKPPGDRMAIVAYDGRGLEMLSSWTSSVPRLQAAFSEALERRPRGLERLAEERNLTRPGGVGVSFGGGRLTTEELFFAAMLERQIEQTVTALEATMRSFAEPPGRKVLILLSGGWPYGPADFAVGDPRRFRVDEEVKTGPELYDDLVDTANLLGYTIYAVDVPGIRQAPTDASVGGVPAEDAITTDRTSFQEREIHTTLRYLSDRTGGKALVNADRAGTLETVVQDTRTYYWLGFDASRTGDDESHAVDVEVTRPGLRIRSRQGYLDSSRQAEVSMAVESTLLFGPTDQRPTLGVALGEPGRSGLGKVEVPLRVLVPLAAVSMIPVGEELVAQLELRIAVKDDRGATAPIQVIPLTLKRSQPPAADTLGAYDTKLELRKRPHEMVVAVYDTVSQRLLSARLSFDPSKE